MWCIYKAEGLFVFGLWLKLTPRNSESDTLNADNVDATMEGRELDSEDSGALVVDEVQAREQVRLSFDPTNIATNSVKKEAAALQDNSQVSLTMTSLKPIVANQRAEIDPSTAGYGPHSLHFPQTADGVV